MHQLSFPELELKLRRQALERLATPTRAAADAARRAPLVDWRAAGGALVRYLARRLRTLAPTTYDAAEPGCQASACMSCSRR